MNFVQWINIYQVFLKITMVQLNYVVASLTTRLRLMKLFFTAMASTSRRGLRVSDQNVKLTSNSTNLISQKSMPAILSRKRKSDHLEMVSLWILFSSLFCRQGNIRSQIGFKICFLYKASFLEENSL